MRRSGHFGGEKFHPQNHRSTCFEVAIVFQQNHPYRFGCSMSSIWFIEVYEYMRNWWILVCSDKHPLVHNIVMVESCWFHSPHGNSWNISQTEILPPTSQSSRRIIRKRHAGPSILCCECSLASWPQMQVNLNDRSKKVRGFTHKKKGWGRGYRIQL